MVKELLELRPRQYLCPFCGTWHQWNERDTLQSRSNSVVGHKHIFGMNLSIRRNVLMEHMQ